jgi:hypothetical protein
MTVKELLCLRLAGDEKTNFYRNINVRLILLRHLITFVFFVLLKFSKQAIVSIGEFHTAKLYFLDMKKKPITFEYKEGLALVNLNGKDFYIKIFPDGKVVEYYEE